MPRSRRRDDDDDDDDTPRKRSRRRDDDDDDDNDDDDTPRKKSHRSDDDNDDDTPRRGSRRRDDDDDDDDDDRPRKKRKALKRSKKSAGGGGPLLLILGLVGGFILLAGGGFALWFFVFNDTPEKAFDDVKEAALKKDYGRYYDRVDKEAQGNIDRGTEGLVNLDPSLSAHRGKKGRELYVAVSQDIAKRPEADFMRKVNEAALNELKEAKVEKVTVDGDNATVVIRTPSGKETTSRMVRQDGKWRLKSGGFR